MRLKIVCVVPSPKQAIPGQQLGRRLVRLLNLTIAIEAAMCDVMGTAACMDGTLQSFALLITDWTQVRD